MGASELKRQRYHHGNLPAALVDAALSLVNEQGAEALTLRAVAQRVGVSHAAPYRHFKDKQALVSTIAAQGFRSLNEAMLTVGRRELQSGITPANAPILTPIGQMTKAYLTFATDNPAHYRVMYGMLAQPSEHPELRREMSKMVAILQQAIEDSSSAPSSSGSRSAGALYWAQLHGLAALQVAGKLAPTDAPSIEALAATLVEEPPAMAAILDDL